MVDSQPELERSRNLYQVTPLSAVELANVMSGGVGKRRRRAVEIGRGEDDPKPRVGPRDAYLHPINMEFCGGLAVDEGGELNGSDQISNSCMQSPRGSGRIYGSGGLGSPAG